MEENQKLDLEFVKHDLDTYYETADKGVRFLNYIIDTIGAYIVTFLVSVMFGLVMAFVNPTSSLIDEQDSFADTMFFYGLTIFCFSLYYVFFEYLNSGKTIGKMLTKTKVVTKSGEKATFVMILGRSLARFIPFDNFSLLFSSKDLAWHDKLSETIVIKDNR